MGKTSNEVKRRYNAKTYTEFRVSLKHEDYNKIEKISEQKKIKGTGLDNYRTDLGVSDKGTGLNVTN